MSQGRQIAAQNGVSNPRLMLAMKYKKNAHTQVSAFDLDTGQELGSITLSFDEVVYPIADFEWNDFIRDIPKYLVENPIVWVVDGSLYTAPI